MPKTKFQNVVFTLMMSFLMVYAMICYNISMNIGGMTNQVFLMAFHEMMIMWPAAFILEFFLVDHLAHKLAFCMVTPQDRPIVITLAISIMIIAIMCPIMSFIATLLFKNAGKEFVAVWLQTTFLNFPVAFFWQLIYCGPFIRFLFRKLFPEICTASSDRRLSVNNHGVFYWRGYRDRLQNPPEMHQEVLLQSFPMESEGHLS